MSRLPYLQRRGGVLHFRIAVPADLRHVLGAADITQSLKTAERAIAAPMALVLAARAKQAYLSGRAGSEHMDRAKLHSFLRDISAEIRSADERARLEAELVELQRKHAQELHMVRLQASHDAIQALAGAHAAGLACVLTPSPPGTSASTAKTTPLSSAPALGKVVSEFLSKGAKSSETAMLKKHRTVLSLLLTSVGDKPVDQIKQADLNRFFELVCKLPPRWPDTCRKRKITPMQLAVLEEGELAPKTFEDTYKASVRLFLKAARRDWQDEGFPVHLSVEGIAYSGAVGDGLNKQRAFRPDELRTLFDALHAAAFKSDHDSAHKYWLPYIGLYTGARVNEICQLNPATDIVQEAGSGIWHFRFTEDTEGDVRVKKSIKTSQSLRRVPVHPKLILDGFLDYVEAQKKFGSKLLFPPWTPTHGRASPAAEKWFRNYLKELGLRDEKPRARLVGMHAFRHLILHRAFNERPPIDVTPITGHADDAGSVVAGYRGEMLLMNKLRILEQVNFSF